MANVYTANQSKLNSATFHLLLYTFAVLITLTGSNCSTLDQRASV